MTKHSHAASLAFDHFLMICGWRKRFRPAKTERCDAANPACAFLAGSIPTFEVERTAPANTAKQVPDEDVS